MARSINKSESRSLLRSLPQKDWVCSEGCFIFGVCGGGGGNSAHCLHCLGCQQLGGVTEKKVFSGLGFLAQRKAFFFSCRLFSLYQHTLPMIINKTSTIFKFWLCLLTSCVILGKLLSLSMPEFSQLYHEDNGSMYLQGCSKNDLEFVKHWNDAFYMCVH